MSRLQGRTAIVTGGGSGIGRAYSERLAREGAQVAIADIDVDSAKATAAKLSAAGLKAQAFAVDIASDASVRQLMADVQRHFGAIDILVNNAALYTAVKRHPWTDIPLEEWDHVMAVNVKGAWLCCRHAFPYMKERGGKIINVSSATAYEGSGANLLHYVVSKGAIIPLTRVLARELGPFNINVNTLVPGLVETERTQTARSREVFNAKAAARSIKRSEKPEDLAGTVVYLASSDSDFVTGETIVVDGGAIKH